MCGRDPLRVLCAVTVECGGWVVAAEGITSMVRIDDVSHVAWRLHTQRSMIYECDAVVSRVSVGSLSFVLVRLGYGRGLRRELRILR